MTEPAPADLLRERLRTDLRVAMRAQRREEMAVLRTLIAAIDNAESVDAQSPPPPARSASAHIAGASAGLGAAEAPRRQLTPAELQNILDSERSERRDEADRFDALGRGDEASRLRFEAEVIARYTALGD